MREPQSGAETTMTRTQFTNGSTDSRSRSPRILLAEDDDALRELLALSLRASGHLVVECRSGMDVVQRVSDFVLSHEPIEFDLVISDIRMPGVTGLEALECMRGFEGWPPTILITAFGNQATHEEARRLGAAAMFDKPFEIDDLLAAVNKLLPHADMR